MFNVEKFKNTNKQLLITESQHQNISTVSILVEPILFSLYAYLSPQMGSQCVLIILCFSTPLTGNIHFLKLNI